MKWMARSFPLCLLLLLSALPPGAQEQRPPEAIAHYRTGFQMLRARDIRNAVIEFERAVAVDSTYGDAQYALGKSYVSLSQFDKAIGALEAARRHEVTSDKARAALPGLLASVYHKSALKARDQKRHAEAIAAFRKSLELQPGNAQAQYGIGLCYSDRRETEKARRAFEKVISLDAEYVQAFKALGDIHRRSREYRQAAEMYTRAIAAEPGFMDGHAGLARVQMETDDVEGAVATLERALEIDPEYAYTHLLLGTALNQQQQYHEAVAPLRRAIDLDADNAETHFRLAQAYYGKGDFRAAVGAAQQAVRRQRNYHAAQATLGDSYAQLGQNDESRTWYLKARIDSRFRDYCDHQLKELDRRQQTPGE